MANQVADHSHTDQLSQRKRNHRGHDKAAVTNAVEK